MWTFPWARSAIRARPSWPRTLPACLCWRRRPAGAAPSGLAQHGAGHRRLGRDRQAAANRGAGVGGAGADVAALDPELARTAAAARPSAEPGNRRRRVPHPDRPAVRERRPPPAVGRGPRPAKGSAVGPRSSFSWPSASAPAYSDRVPRPPTTNRRRRCISSRRQCISIRRRKRRPTGGMIYNASFVRPKRSRGGAMSRSAADVWRIRPDDGRAIRGPIGDPCFLRMINPSPRMP